ncbi:hypothetical protein KI387_032192, partial [Taxus chinensis]
RRVLVPVLVRGDRDGHASFKNIGDGYLEMIKIKELYSRNYDSQYPFELIGNSSVAYDALINPTNFHIPPT